MPDRPAPQKVPYGNPVIVDGAGERYELSIATLRARPLAGGASFLIMTGYLDALGATWELSVDQPDEVRDAR